MLYGRRSVPGEKGVQGALDQRNVLNRILRAQVAVVSPENGYVIINYENMPSGGKYVTVPPLWMSFPDAATGSGPAWGRYMPQQSDLVKIGFGYDDKPHILGFDIVAGKVNVGDGESGWAQLHDQYQAGKSSEDAQRAKFAQFSPLNPGEYDFMSSGGSYIYGNNRGKLYLAGGAVSISLVKNDLRISQRSQLWSHIADDCEFRFGQVRRVDSTDQLDKSINTGKEKEFSISLNTTVIPGSSLNLSILKIGNIINDLGEVQKTEVANQDLRWSYRSFNDQGIETFKEMIDKVGNWEISAPQATTGVNFDFSASDWLVKFKNVTYTISNLYKIESNTIDHTAIDSCKIASPQIEMNATSDFTINSPIISLGGTGSSVNPLLITSLYRPAEIAFANGLAAQVATLASAVASLASGFVTLSSVISGAGAAMVVPVAGAVTASPILVAGGAAAATVGGAVATTATSVASVAPTVANSFTTQYDTYLSKISSTR